MKDVTMTIVLNRRAVGFMFGALFIHGAEPRELTKSIGMKLVRIEPKVPPPPARFFRYDQLADTLSSYIQGDVNAKPGAPECRAGDVRFVFGVPGREGRVHEGEYRER